jgi:hypothetical protein
VPIGAINTEIAGINTSITGINTSITGINTSLSAINTSLTSDESAITSLQSASANYSTEITNIQSQTKFISTGTDENGFPAMFITQCNLWLQDGSGTTWDNYGALTGLGNLIIGYNELGQGNPNGDTRTGSHNLIVGVGNSYTSYGGVIFGFCDTSSAVWAAVTGGQFNTASSDWASISGGLYNSATGSAATVSGGAHNTASGAGGSISGGYGNSVINDPTSPGGALSYGSILGGLDIVESTLYGHSP